MSKTLSATTATAIIAVLALEGVTVTEEALKAALFSLIAGEPVTLTPTAAITAGLQPGEFFTIWDSNNEQHYGQNGEINTPEILQSELAEIYSANERRYNDGWNDFSDDVSVFIVRRELSFNVERNTIFTPA